MTITLITFLVLALATYRLCRLVIEDALLEDFRDWVWSHKSPDTKLGYLITCYHCMSIWAGSLVVLAYILGGPVAFAVLLVLALSAVVGFIQTFLDR